MGGLCNLYRTTNFDSITSQHWVCCGQRMCTKCDANQINLNTGERSNCPFCRSPEIYGDDPKFQSQNFFPLFVPYCKTNYCYYKNRLNIN